jgi:hypothetical protein
MPRLLPLVLCLLCTQSALLVAFATGSLGLGAFASIHLAMCVAAGTFGRWWLASPPGNADDDTAMVLQLAVWTTLAGPLGTVVAAALLVPRSAEANLLEASSAADAARPELSRVELLHFSLLDSRLRLEHAHTVRPLLDIILEGTQPEKFDALSLISKRYDAALAAVLRRALEDKDGSVRVLAATVMAQQHNAFTKAIGALQSAARAAPETPGHWSDLAQAHFDYAASGLLEPSRVEAETGQAFDHLTRAANLDPGNAVIRARLDGVRGLAASEGMTPIAADDRVKERLARDYP